MSLAELEGIPTVIIKPDLMCQSFDVELKTDGKLELEGKWATVPSFGIRQRMLFGDKYIMPSTFLVLYHL